jgi:KaiC domain protein
MGGNVTRLSLGIPKLDELLEGGIPRNFFVAVTGEPGTGKTILCIHFINKGINSGDRNIYVTTEESKESIITQAAQFNMDFRSAIENNKLIIIDALMGTKDQWSLESLDTSTLVDKIIEAKKSLGYGQARLVVDSLSAFWLDRPAMARRESYFLKKVLAKWDFTILVTSQYAITTASAFGWGVEHVADGIIRFRRMTRDGVLRRYLIIEKMRQTNHSLNLQEIEVLPGEGLVMRGPVSERREDFALPKKVTDRIKRASEMSHDEPQ